MSDQTKAEMLSEDALDQASAAGRGSGLATGKRVHLPFTAAGKGDAGLEGGQPSNWAVFEPNGER